MQKVTLFSQHNPENLLHKWPYQLLWLELYAISLKNSITPKWKISLKHCYAIFIWVVSHTRLLHTTNIKFWENLKNSENQKPP